jgi:hypothetical protein
MLLSLRVMGTLPALKSVWNLLDSPSVEVMMTSITKNLAEEAVVVAVAVEAAVVPEMLLREAPDKEATRAARSS